MFFVLNMLHMGIDDIICLFFAKPQVMFKCFRKSKFVLNVPLFKILLLNFDTSFDQNFLFTVLTVSLSENVASK